VLVRERAELARLMAAFVGFALLLAATATPTDVLNGELAVAGGNEIQLGVASGLGLLAIGGFLLFVGPFPWRLLWLAPAGFLAYTVLNAGSRGALISSGLAVVFLCLRQLVIERSWLLTLVVAAAVAGILAFGGSLSSQSAVSKYEETLFSNDPARIVGGRDYLLQLGKELALAHPFGLGVGGYDAVTGGLQYPHNLLLELADEEGLLGVLLTLALIVSAWFARLAAPGGWRTPEVGLSGALIIFAASESMFSFDINGNRLLWFAVGLAAALPGFRASGVAAARSETDLVGRATPRGIGSCPRSTGSV
jgi:O-antigen ligase